MPATVGGGGAFFICVKEQDEVIRRWTASGSDQQLSASILSSLFYAVHVVCMLVGSVFWYLGKEKKSVRRPLIQLNLQALIFFFSRHAIAFAGNFF